LLAGEREEGGCRFWWRRFGRLFGVDEKLRQRLVK